MTDKLYNERCPECNEIFPNCECKKDLAKEDVMENIFKNTHFLKEDHINLEKENKKLKMYLADLMFLCRPNYAQDENPETCCRIIREYIKETKAEIKNPNKKIKYTHEQICKGFLKINGLWHRCQKYNSITKSYFFHSIWKTFDFIQKLELREIPPQN